MCSLHMNTKNKSSDHLTSRPRNQLGKIITQISSELTVAASVSWPFSTMDVNENGAMTIGDSGLPSSNECDIANNCQGQSFTLYVYIAPYAHFGSIVRASPILDCYRFKC
ncbi:uncharacterized protein [Malus domestica]|uniref:uncharacterized protein n=1 Tax=Malus domestica TaxID=3750 RepID=UPI0039769FAB